MSSFTKDLTITKIKVRKRKLWAFLPWVKERFKMVDMWRVDKAFDYHVGSKDSEEVIHIPEGFQTDGASIPSFLWPIIGHPMEEYAQAAVVHDYLYTSEDKLEWMNLVGSWKVYKYTRKKCDWIFYEAMGVLKILKAKRATMYYAVRCFGAGLWRKRGKDIDNESQQQ